MYKIKYTVDFIKHSKGGEGHLVTDEDKRLREVLLKNYFKSLGIFNAFAVYFNYIRKNKSFMKTTLSKI